MEAFRIPPYCQRICRMEIWKMPNPIPEGLDLGLIRSNAAKNKGRGRKVEPKRSGSVILVGNGEWDSLPLDADVIAVGSSAAERLNAIGIVPDYLVVTDPHVRRLPLAADYIVATQCDPDLFSLYNPLFFGVMEGLPNGLASFKMAEALGYNDLHLVGYDCSVEEGPLRLILEGRVYTTTEKLYHRLAQPFCNPLIQEAINFGMTVTIYGDGALANMCKAIYAKPKAVAHLATYPLDICSGSYDFFTWMANIRLHTDAEIRVSFTGDVSKRTDAMSVAQRQQMVDHVIRPSLSLFGAVEDPLVKTDRMAPISYLPLSEAARAGKPIYRIRLGVPKLHNRLVITLRETSYALEKNSDLEAWKAFAAARQAEGWDVLFIRDTAKADEPLPGFATDPVASRDLHVRARRYEEAYCNLSIVTGPISLLLFSDNPFIVFNPLNHVPNYPPADPRWWRYACGVEPGGKFPWLSDSQDFVWERDSLHTIESAWACWKARTYFDTCLVA